MRTVRKRCMAVYILVGIMALAGCVSSSGVFRAGKDTYKVVTQGEAKKPDLVQQAYYEANQYCEEHGKVLQPISTTYGKLPRRQPSFELTFRALEPDDPRYRPPQMEKVPDAKVEVETKKGD